MKLRQLLTPIKSIRKKCLECCCDQRKEVRECLINWCAIWPYRLGKRPDEETIREYENAEEP